ncbi:hypothetical protein HNQ60_002561 [Povalibacter uvarum]|uniref:FAD-binding PCMH-type domain-containing protein n=1 Tax=Povalibacter uvarum TaxID=732238 RepID=A0A841HN31_9GAMM|nr:FAD-binding oxidoreductase [Povalibacter uvarum]MBB6093680.1 hypothetical protein [Povalibacter uvarum]
MKRRAFLQASAGVAALWPMKMVMADATGASLPDIIGTTLIDGQVTLRSAAIRDLASSLRGAVLVSGHAGYDQARQVWNGMFDRHPALIVQCASTSDVMRAVSFAREHELLTAIRCGGHSLSGKSTCDGGIVIDLSSMQSVRVDPNALTARVEGGTLLRHLDRETRAFGLVTTAGTVSHTGVGGLTLGGGFGRVARRFGLACDNVRAVDVVTADGKLVTADAVQNPDLLWAVRGGGGNFGVVTSFEFQLHPMDATVLGGRIAWPYAQIRDVLEFYAEFSARAPDELNCDPAILPGGPDGKGMVVVETCWSADKNAGERVLQPLRALGKPLFDQIGAKSYVALQSQSDEANAFGRRFYGKSGFLGELRQADIDTLIEVSASTVPAGVALVMQQGGGAIGRAPIDSAAFANRNARYWTMVAKGWTDPSEDARHIGNVRMAWKQVEPRTDGFYVNAMADDEFKRVAGNYGSNYPRLAKIKRRYDPGNLFRLNANILPA